VYALRAIFALYLTLVLVWYVPGHQRGQITIGRKSADVATSAALAEPVSFESHSCCAEKPAPKKPGEPTDADRRACFICFWVAGLIVVEPFTLQMEFHELLYASAQQYDAQVRAVADRLNHYGRDPPFAC
jgi:hypothetical protein